MDIPKRYRRSKLSDFGDEMAGKVKDAIEAGDLITLLGPTGSGKTHMAMAVGRQVPDTMIYNTSEFALECQATVSEWGMGEFKKLIDKICRCPGPVIFDDLGSEKMTEFIHQALLWIISYREGEILCTVITTNKSMDEISESLDDRIASRMSGGCVIELDDDDHRTSKGVADA